MNRNTRLRNRLAQPNIVVAPGAYDALTAKIVEAAGFEALYMSGAGVSYSLLGKPDIGLTTMSEMVRQAGYICEAVSIPVIADADTGFGGTLNVYRTVRDYERAGVSCIQLEDQLLPKRCGHMDGKTLVSPHEMVARIKAACDAREDTDLCIMARTDALAVEGIEAALERAHLYREAGADVLFIEAPDSPKTMAALCAAFPGVPLLANLVEGGKTPLLPAAELEAMGFRLVIYPGAAGRVATKAVSALMAHLKATGTTSDYRDHMFSFGEVNNLLGLDALREQERRYAREGE